MRSFPGKLTEILEALMARQGRAAGRRGARAVASLEKRALQVAVVAAATVAVAGGGWGVVTALGEDVSGLASHERYLSGLLFAIGLAFWTTVPDIESKSERFRLLTVLVVAGGLCRLLGVALGDTLSGITATALVMELLVAPTLCLWQCEYASAP
jgi:hypothetical protein